MAKKFSLLLAAVAVLAFAIPSMASATKATLPAGTLAPVGTSIVGTGTDVTLKSSLLGTITCSTLNLNGSITKNNGTVVEGSGATSAPTQSGCKNGTKSVNVTSVVLTKLFSEKESKGTASFEATVDVGSELVCKFTGTNVAGTFTSGTNVLKFSGATGVTASPASCGTSTLTAEFALEKSGTSESLILDS